MKYFKFDRDLLLKIPETDNSVSRSSHTAQIDFLKRNLSDLQKKIGAIKELTLHLSSINYIWDLMAGCGFSGKVLKKYLAPDKILFNDLDSRCVKVLQENFPKIKVTEKDIFKFPFKRIETPDLTFIDFNTFTLKKAQEWDGVFKKIESRILVITDSACFGFKFGNLKAYDCETQIDYYRKLSKYMWDHYHFGIQDIFPFGPACLVLMYKAERSTEIKEHSSDSIKIFIQYSKGFGL